MRIVHILQGNANPEIANGVNTAVHHMATYQMRQGHDVEIWGLSASKNLPPHLRTYYLRIFLVTWLRVTLGREIKDALDRLEPGTWVHFHSVFIPEFPAIARLLKKRGFSYSITPHGGYALALLKRNLLKHQIYIALREAKLVRNAAWIHAIGESEIKDILRIAPQARIVLIPHGQETLPACSGDAPVKAERPLIGFCGRLATQHKGLDFLLEGFAAYKANGGKGELWLIGDGADRGLLQSKAAESGAQSHVRFLGVKLGVEKLYLLSSFDIFIHCSRWEGLPGACLEAAALGRPLLVSRETNLAGYVEQYGAGLVLDETSAAGVERALDRVQELYQNNQLQQLGENARQLVVKEFNWEVNARNFVAAIKSAVFSFQ
jgi:glycosyltransferase involved in cell wall biosynthesis